MLSILEHLAVAYLLGPNYFVTTRVAILAATFANMDYLVGLCIQEVEHQI
jgi:hypothetical protein